MRESGAANSGSAIGSVIGSWVSLVAALVALVAGLSAFALSGLRRGAGPFPELIEKLLGGRFGGFLLLVAIGSAVAALLVVMAVALITLASGNTRSRTTRRAVPEVRHVPPTERTDDGRWIKLAEGCVEVMDELEQNKEAFDAQGLALAEHVTLRLEEMLERSGVDVIKDEASYDRTRHRPVRGGGANLTGATISETVSPGFAVGQRVLRRARVRVEGASRDANG